MATNLENKISRIATNVAAALNALSAKGVSVSGKDSDDLATLIGYLVKLPTLTAAGAAADLRNGKQLIDGIGNIVKGTMPEQEAQTITPGTSDKTIAAGRYLTGTQTIKGDSNLVAANIASGKTIFGVAGTFSGGGKYVTGTFDMSSGTATHTVTHNLGKIPNVALGIKYGMTINATRYYLLSNFYINGTHNMIEVTNYSWADAGLTTAAGTLTDARGQGFGSATTSGITFSRNKSDKGDAVSVLYMIGVI